MAERSSLSRARVLVTGGAGFIGSNFVHRLLAKHPGAHAVVLDALTYAGRRENLDGLPATRLTFVHGDIRNSQDVAGAMKGCDLVVNFAAELAAPLNDPAKPFEHIAYTVPWNMSENPAASINGGFSSKGFPIGVQIVGRRFDDLGVLGMAKAFEGLRGPQKPWPKPPKK